MHTQASEPIIERRFVVFVSTQELEGFNITGGLDKAVNIAY